MDAQLERRGVPIGPVPGEYGQRRIRSSEIDAPEMQAPNPVSARSETDLLLDRLHRAALSDDGREMHAVGRDYLRSPNGQAWRPTGRASCRERGGEYVEVGGVAGSLKKKK